jgi:hypothetical protein
MTNVEDTEASLTLKEFCEVENICLASYYKMRKRGHAPVETRIPGTAIIRITPEARREWHRMLAAIAQSDAARLEVARKRVQTIASGKAAAASPLHVNARRAAARGRVTP